ncbi:hypothetical protein Salat_2998000 [Sesamum alatum]|uniref:Uncharacterized protein n=2 Tax=Sesamum TaxID=4181 RepID=A0AAE1XIE4_9LAMI|nr:hypothetical protein Salat_2998000 [Sesamum alatum]
MSSCLTRLLRLINHYIEFYDLSLPPSHTSLDVARHLESLNTATPAGLGADPALNLLLELHNPASELYIEATRLLLSCPVDDIEAVTEVVSDMKGCLKDLMLRTCSVHALTWGAMESRCSVAEVYSLRPYLPVLEPLLLMSPLVQVLSPVLESAPSYAHVVASAATRNLRSPAMEKDLLLSMP